MAHEPATRTWIAIVLQLHQHVFSVVRLDDDAHVLEERPFPPVSDAAVISDGRSIVYVADDGLHVLDCADLTSRRLDGRRG